MAHSPASLAVPLSTRASMLRGLFDFFERASLPYCVVGDARTLPGNISSDVDIVVERAALPTMPALLERFGTNYGTRLVQSLQHEPNAFQFVLSWHREDDTACFLQVDVCSDYVRRGRRYLNAHELLARRTRLADASGGFYVAAPADEFIYYLIKKIDKGHLSAHHGRHLSARWHEAPGEARAQLARFWPETHVTLLSKTAQDGDWGGIAAVMPSLQRALHRRARRTGSDLARATIRIIHRFRHPTGLMVAILGPDGSGKTSVIEAVQAQLAPVFRHAKTHHFRPQHTESNGTTVTAPHSQPPRGVSASIAKLGFYLLAFGGGYAYRIWPRLARSTLVMFDRYYDDLCIDARRYRYGGPSWLARWVHPSIPTPDLLIVLDAPVTVLHARKPEIAPHEAARLRTAYRAWAARHPNGHVVDTAASLDNVANQVTDLILNHLAARTARRLHLTEGTP